MSYDPFARGPFPVGVRTLAPQRDGRALAVEVWYPAADAHAGADTAEATRDAYWLIPGFPALRQDAVRDAAPRPGRRPLTVFSHGYGGHRRQSTFLCTHLASHGHVVAAVDHAGNTVIDVMQAVLAAMRASGARADAGAVLREFIASRPEDVRVTIDALCDGALGGLVDAGRIGVAGHSFGGWTALTVTARDPRIRAVLPLAPAGGTTPLPVDALCEALDLRWGRDVPTLFVVAERDTLLPLAGMRELLERTPSSRKRMVVLRNADHMHFCDRVEEVHELFRLMPHDPVLRDLRAAIPPIGELCPGTHGYLTVRGLAVAHMDAHLRDDAEAARFLAGDLAAALAARGVAASVA